LGLDKPIEPYRTYLYRNKVLVITKVTTQDTPKPVFKELCHRLYQNPKLPTNTVRQSTATSQFNRCNLTRRLAKFGNLYAKNELFPDPPPNDIFPLPGQPATCLPGFHQNLLPDNNKFIAAMPRIKTGTALVRTICRLSGTVSSIGTNSFPALWTRQRNYISQFTSCSFIY
jgi:hypothetical protein